MSAIGSAVHTGITNEIGVTLACASRTIENLIVRAADGYGLALGIAQLIAEDTTDTVSLRDT